MNKKEIIAELASRTGFSQKDSAKFLNSFTEVVQEKLQDGESVSIIGFGQFVLSDRAERTAKDFRTGKQIRVPAMKVVKFKVGKTLKEAVK